MKEFNHEMFWKEVVALSLIAVFSMVFWHRIDNHSLYIGFLLLSAAFYIITVAEEKQSRTSKNASDYFHHASSYFILSLLFFASSYFMAFQVLSGFAYFLLSIAVVLFSVGFMKLLFARLEK